MGIDPDIGGAVALLSGMVLPTVPEHFAGLTLDLLDAPAVVTDNSKRKFRRVARRVLAHHLPGLPESSPACPCSSSSPSLWVCCLDSTQALYTVWQQAHPHILKLMRGAQAGGHGRHRGHSCQDRAGVPGCARHARAAQLHRLRRGRLEHVRPALLPLPAAAAQCHSCHHMLQSCLGPRQLMRACGCSFNGGFSFGTWCGALAAHGVPCTPIKALSWKRQLSLLRLGKEGSRLTALELFPQAAGLLKCVAPAVPAQPVGAQACAGLRCPGDTPLLADGRRTTAGPRRC